RQHRSEEVLRAHRSRGGLKGPGFHWGGATVRSLRWMLAALCLWGFAAPLLSVPQSFSVGQWGNLEIDLPEGWTAGVQGPEAEGGTAIRIQPPSSIPLELLMTPIPAPGDEKDLAAAV